MAKYTIEDVEILRQKSGISYDEAVNLLEYHNGSLARALMDLEKNGRINANNAKATSHKGFKGLLNTLYRIRLVVKKESAVILNLSALAVLIVAILAPHVLIIGLILCLALGYRMNIDRTHPAFVQDSLDDIVKNARSNVQNTMHAFARQFAREEETNEKPQPEAEPTRPQSAPTATRPVNVTFEEGGPVNVRDDGDGYHEADIQ